MNRFTMISLALVLVGPIGCSKDDLNNYSLGAETYPGYPDCKQAYFKGEPIPGIFVKKFIKANGERVEGVACHDKNYVIDAKTGNKTEGSL